jgi:hypothetical protein
MDKDKLLILQYLTIITYGMLLAPALFAMNDELTKRISVQSKMYGVRNKLFHSFKEVFLC